MEVKFYKVGGCVRDSLLGVKSKDIDYSVEAPSYEVMENAIRERGGEIFDIPKAKEHLTIRAKVPELGCADFVLCRKDGTYSDGRHPDSVSIGTIYDDLARRDFTMNAIAQKEDGTLIDPFGGQHDISIKLIRCVGAARTRFEEDKLRLLRAIRFSITKNFDLDKNIRVCLNDNYCVKNLQGVSVERIREELYKAFEANSNFALDALIEFPLIRYACLDKGIWFKPTIKA